MKKKLLLMLSMVFAFALVLAFSVSASYIYKDTNGTQIFSFVDETNDMVIDSYTGEFAKTDANNVPLTWYITKTETSGSDTIFTVDCLPTLPTEGYECSAGTINASGAYSFASPVTNKNAVSINFPDNQGIKSWAFNSFGGFGSRKNLYTTNSILFVYCPNTMTTFANNPFQETNVLVVELDDETPIKEIPQNFAHEARSLRTINIPASVTKINGNSGQNGAPFYNNYSLASVTFASDSNLTTLLNSCFQNCSSLTSINLPNSITTIGKNAFSSCTSLESISLPNSLETIMSHAFAWCTAIKEIRMGASFKYFNNTGDNSFTYSTGSVNAIYIPNSFYKTAPDTSNGYQVSYAFHGASSNCKFFYCGTIEEFNKAKENFLTQKSATSNNGKFLNAKVITLKEYNDNLDNYATGNYVICEYSSCDAFYDNQHVGKEVINYVIYASDGNKTQGKQFLTTAELCTECTRCLSTQVNETIAPLFTSVGFSFSDDSVMQGFAINYDVLDDYEKYYGNDISFGLACAVKENVTDGKLLECEKKATVDYTEKSFDIFEMKLSGIGSDAYKETELFICAYVIMGEKTYYISNGEIAENTIGFEFSYSTIVK